MAVHYIDNLTDKLDDAKLLISLIKTVKLIELDTETTGLDPFASKVLLLQLNVNNEIFVLNVGKLGVKFISNLLTLINFLGITCIGHNIKFDSKHLYHEAGVWLSKVYDTMVMESVITAGLGGKYASLGELVKKYSNIDLDKTDRLEFTTLTQESDFTERQITYAALDVLYLFDIFSKQIELAAKAGLSKVIALESKVTPIVAKMEYEGIILDIPYWRNLTQEAEKKAVVVEQKMKETIFNLIDKSRYLSALDFALAVAIPVKTKKLTKELESILDPNIVLGWITDNFNVHSHKQLLTVLNLVGVETPDTNEKTLNKLPKNEVIDILLEFRDYEKRLSTYGNNVIQVVNPVTGRIHTDFNQLGTASGRFSSSGDINMQNIPTHNGYREGFISREGYSFIACDFSQQEYKLAGAISREPKIIEAYVKGFDMHTATASLRFGVPLADVTKEQRNKGKAVNFTILYGGTEYALGKNLGIPKKEALEILEQFLANYPILAAWKAGVEEKIVKLGYSITLLGRRRYWKPLPSFSTPGEILQYENRMKREGINHVTQGTGADVTKLSMIRLDENNPFGDKFIPILQVHDEIVAEVQDDILKEADEWMKYEMNAAFQPFLREIPAKCDSIISKRWTKS